MGFIFVIRNAETGCFRGWHLIFHVCVIFVRYYDIEKRVIIVTFGNWVLTMGLMRLKFDYFGFMFYMVILFASPIGN